MNIPKMRCTPCKISVFGSIRGGVKRCRMPKVGVGSPPTRQKIEVSSSSNAFSFFLSEISQFLFLTLTIC